LHTSCHNGDDYVINGRKWFSSSADGATFAVVMAITNPAAKPHERATQIIVPTNTPGYRLVRNTPVMGHRGEDWASHGEREFKDCRVPQSNRLGAEGAGFMLAQERLGPGRIYHCMRWIGICERALELMCAYAAKRQLAPGVPMASRQLIQARAHLKVGGVGGLETAAIASVHAEQLVMPRHRKGVNACDNYATLTCVG